MTSLTDTERDRVALDALVVLAGAETVQKRLLAGLSMGNPSIESSAYLIKSRIVRLQNLLDKLAMELREDLAHLS